MSSYQRLYECIQNKKVNNSHAREAIYRVLMESGDCMTVHEINKRLKEEYPRKVSLNTIYRHLTLFVECGLVVVIQDDFKKAYYVLTSEQASVFSICPKCNAVSKVVDIEEFKSVLGSLKFNEFITIHQQCLLCRE